MNDPVLMLIEKTLLSKSYHVIRYNSRGVGGSSGWPSLSGSAEANDLNALVAWVRETITDTREIIIAGYSYGSLIASLQLQETDISHILISYPLGPRIFLTGLFNSKRYKDALANLLRSPAERTLFVYGTQDEFTSESTYQTALSGCSDHSATISVVDDASHFWSGKHGMRLKEIVEEWLASRQH